MVDATSGKAVDGALLSTGVVDLDKLKNTNVSISAITSAQTGSVRFEVQKEGEASPTTEAVDTRLFTNKAFTPTAGVYTLTATPYLGADASGAAGAPYKIKVTFKSANPPPPDNGGTSNPVTQPAPAPATEVPPATAPATHPAAGGSHPAGT